MNTYIRKNFNEVTDAELEYISARLDADYWLWQSMLGAGALEQGELIFFTDSDRWMDYQVEIVAANGHENPIQRYSWAYAHQMVISYISYLAGNDDLAVAGIVGARDENLLEQYALLYQAIANDGLKRIYCFSDYISSTE